MWWKNKIFIWCGGTFLLFVGLVGCIQQEIIVPIQKNFQEVNHPEDVLIMQGYAALDAENYADAKELFTKAYQFNQNPSYLKEILGILVAQNDLENAKINAYQYLEKYPKDEEVRAALVGILTNTGDFQSALKEARIALKNHKNAQNYELLSSVYFLQQDFKNAAKYLQSAYNLDQNELLLDKLAAIHLLFLKNPRTAIQLYETHIKTNGISQLIGEKLALIYAESRDHKNAARIYKMLFEELGTQDYAKIALEIYIKTKQLDLAESFLLKNPKIEEGDKILFEIYRLKKDIKKSIQQAEIIYQNTQEVEFLAYKAMMLYESTNPKTKQQLKQVEEDLKKVVNEKDDALYWNYLGYLMIDHDFNDKMRVQEGMQYVQNALKHEEENSYYLDSLAWGYYKLKQCQSAKEIMEKIPEEKRESEEEIRIHYKEILQCK